MGEPYMSKPFIGTN